MNNFMETYGKEIFVLVIVAILIAFASPLGIKVKTETTAKVNQTTKIGKDEITIATGGVIRPDKPATAVDQVYCIYYTDGELVVAQNEIEPESGRTAEKQDFYSKPSDCTTQMTTARFEGAVMPKSCNEWFCECKNLKQIKNMENLYTDECTSMYKMFYNCRSLTSLNISGWNTGNVRTMSYMFRYCKYLTNLDISGWNTSNVRTMYSMFGSCISLTNLDISRWNTGNVTNMSYMFRYCTSLTNLDISGWNTSNVRTMYSMFLNCTSLTNLDISGWNTGNVTNMQLIFNECNELTEVKVSQETYNKMTALAEENNNTVKDYIHLNPSIIKY